jgi:predicted lipid-binding transport protein (Tim44 family)
VKPTDAEPDAAFERLIARGLAGEADASGVACPDADLLAAWFDHSLSSAEADRIEAHASSCSHCQQVLGDLARSEPAVTRAAPLPAPAKPWHWHWRWLVPLATAAVVVVVAQRTLRAPGEEPGGATIQPGLAQPQSTVADTREPAAPRNSATVPTLAQPKKGEAAKPAAAAPTHTAEEVRVEAKTVGGVAGGAPVGVVGVVVGGVAKGRADVQAENIAVAVPAQAPPVAMRTATSSKLESAARETAELIHSTSGAGPSGATATWRYGEGGLVERSPDGGRTWQRQTSGVSTALADGSASTDLVCWLVGARGVVLRTTDGRTWERLPSPTSADLVSVHAWSESVATVTAADRTAYETADGGRTWRMREPGAALLP